MNNGQGIILGLMVAFFVVSGCEVSKLTPTKLHDAKKSAHVDVVINDSAPIAPIPIVSIPEPIIQGPFVPSLGSFFFPPDPFFIFNPSPVDLCPNDNQKSQPGVCGCDRAETDTDEDGVPDCEDNCINDFNINQLDVDNDERGAACDCDDNNALAGHIEGIARYVDPLGNNGGNSCIDEDDPCSTIAHAIAEANPKDTLVLSNGTFNEANILVDKGLNIFGKDVSGTIIDAQSLDRVFLVNPSTEVIFCGLTIVNGLKNDGDDRGGGIFISDTADVELRNITLKDNAADFGGAIGNNGVLTISNSTISENDANFGGAIFNEQGSITIKSSVLSGNEATFGAAIENTESKLSITDSTLSHNEGTFGGGVENTDSELAVLRSTFSNNKAVFGGGLVNFGSEVSVNNSTFSANTATFGGAIQNTSTNLAISNSTFANNKANFGGALENFGTATISRSIFATNLTDDCSNMGLLISSGSNLETGTSCDFNQSGDLQNTDANLLPLRNNGGPTMTHALNINSDAIDAGGTVCGVSTDQRGEKRPVDFIGVLPDGGAPRCDIGAFEIQPK